MSEEKLAMCAFIGFCFAAVVAISVVLVFKLGAISGFLVGGFCGAFFVFLAIQIGRRI